MELKRQEFASHGVFGTLYDEHGEVLCKTLEHAYTADNQTFFPKVPKGIYACERGVHQLSKGSPFVTFEVKGVPGHTGILFHVGNWNDDSSGCILLGQFISTDMLVGSNTAFKKFMDHLVGVNSFDLTVS